MALSSFAMQEAVVLYSHSKQASPVPHRLAKLEDPEDRCVFGAVDFSDDHSVHADYWERHPAGDEILCVLDGRLVVTVDLGGAAKDAVIAQGQAFIVPRGRWHRLSVLEPGRLVFLTPTAGSERRPHDASLSHPAPQITKGDPL